MRLLSRALRIMLGYCCGERGVVCSAAGSHVAALSLLTPLGCVGHAVHVQHVCISKQEMYSVHVST